MLDRWRARLSRLVVLDEWCVYRAPASRMIRDPIAWPAGLGWERMAPATIDRYFRAEPALHQRFMELVSYGFVGVVLHEADGWVAVAWMTTRDSRGPLHMPGSVAGSFWIVNGHTREAHRGKGHHGRAMQLLAKEAAALTGDPDALVMTDVIVDNVPSRRSVYKIGFVDAGTVRTLNVARLGQAWARWDRTRAHPPMPAPAAPRSAA